MPYIGNVSKTSVVNPNWTVVYRFSTIHRPLSVIASDIYV